MKLNQKKWRDKVRGYNLKHRKYKALWQKKKREDPEYRKYEQAKALARNRKKGIMSWAQRYKKYEGNRKWKALKD